MMFFMVVFRELFRISMNNYQEWFKVAITFWLQTFREECMRRMEKALEIEKDVCLSAFFILLLLVCDTVCVMSQILNIGYVCFWSQIWNANIA